MNPPPLAGYVYKRTKAEWKSRYAILNRGVLTLFKHKRNSFPCNTILLAGCTFHATDDDMTACAFAISHPSRPPTTRMLLATSEPQVFSTWLHALQVHSLVPVGPPVLSPSLRPSSLPFEIPAADNRDVPPTYRGLVEPMVHTFLAQYVHNDPRWTLETDHGGVKSVQLYSCHATRAAAMSRLMIKHASDDIATVVVDPTFDATVRDSIVLDTFNEHTTVLHVTTKAMFPHRARDFVVLTHRRTLPDQSVVVVSQSIPTPPTTVTSHHHTDRANLLMEGYHIVPNSDDTAAEVTYVVHVDGDDSLPDDVVVSRALKLDVLRTLLEPPGPATSPRAHRAIPRAISQAMAPSNTPNQDNVPSPQEDDVGEYTIPPEFVADVDQAIAMLVDATKPTNLTAWSFLSERMGVRAYSKPDGTSLTSVLGMGPVPFPASTILGFLLDTGRKVAYDPMCAAAYPITRLDAHTVLDYYASKPVLIVSGRDFVNVVHWRVLPDKSIVVVAKATESNLMPPKAGLVRGEIHVAGWHIVPSTPSSADVTFLVKMDLKGSIPTFVQNKIVVDQAFVILALRSQLEALPRMKSFRVKNESTGRMEAAPVLPLDTCIDTTNPSILLEKTSPDKTRRGPEPTKKGSIVWIDDTPPTAVSAPVPMTDLNTWKLGLYAAVFLAALFVLPTLLGWYTVLCVGLAFLASQHYQEQPSTPCQKPGHLASWKASIQRNGELVQGTLVVDCSDTLAYLEQHKRRSGESKVTLTHVVIRAVAHAIRQTPSLHDRVAFESFCATSDGVDVSCLVDIRDGKDVGSVTLKGADALSIQSIATEVVAGAGRARSGQPSASLFWPTNRWAQSLPSSLVTLWIRLMGWTSYMFPSLDLQPHRYSHAIVANVGNLGFDDAVHVPTATLCHVPLTVVIGAISKQAVVVEHEDENRVVVRPMARLNVMIDPQYADPATVPQFTRHLRDFVEHPSVLDVGATRIQ
ncbi:hypothetical protein DYB32_009933 [Aphanomyces invadans]|uniref:START domain-containing protein n=1 Tax=Aphanomyces invadans TaxID=157072 RepID=A0A418AHE7_9STRA|nr:hypothetical protein DYB32_009933 [Aphanomyces invadans]